MSVGIFERADSRIDIRCERDEAGVGKATRDVAFVLDQAKSLVQDKDARIGSRRLGTRQIGLHLKAVAGESDILGIERFGIFDFTRQCHFSYLARFYRRRERAVMLFPS